MTHLNPSWHGVLTASALNVGLNENSLKSLLPFSDLRSTVKRDRFFAHVHFSNETVSQTTVSSGPMKMFPLEHETMCVCQNKHCMFCSRGGLF